MAHDQSRRNSNLIIILVLLTIVGALAYKFLSKPTVSPQVQALAQCLADKKVVMYGANWCSHCKAQKARFGQYWKLVPYVECVDEPQKCIDAGVKSYPTWIFPDSKKLTGEQELTQLAKESGCPAPN